VSAATEASKLLRPGLLDGVRLLVAGSSGAGGANAAHERFGSAVAATCAELGALVSAWRPGEAVAADVDRLVVDAAALFAASDSREAGANPARAALDACLQQAWEATRAVAGTAFIDAERPGRVVYVAPVSTAGGSPGATHAEAARAGLENLARTLSIEWARFAVTLVTIAPGEHTSAAEVAAITAFLGSAAGAYYSGCLLDLRGPGGAAAAASR
jgi:hypothetical protein